MELCLWLSERVDVPKLHLSTVYKSTCPSLEPPISAQTEMLFDVWAPTEEGVRAIYDELGAWLMSVPGDWVLMYDTFEPIASRIGGVLELGPHSRLSFLAQAA